MINFTAQKVISGKIHWHFDPDRDENNSELNLSFYYYNRLKRREAIRKVIEDITENNLQWITFKDNSWILDATLLKNEYEQLNEIEWLKGRIIVEPEVEDEIGEKYGEETNTTRISFYLSEEIVNMQSPTKIFLSHKGINKPLVREFFSTLKLLGFDPWLDEDAMTAGVELERGISQGFKDSCAAVFFITPEFQDENFLATEVNYALREKREKGNRFSIIALVFENEKGESGKVPELLRTYVWKVPGSQLKALEEIVKALPISLINLEWKEN